CPKLPSMRRMVREPDDLPTRFTHAHILFHIVKMVLVWICLVFILNSIRKCNSTKTARGQAAVPSWHHSPPGKRRTNELHAATRRGTIPNSHSEESRIWSGGDC